MREVTAVTLKILQQQQQQQQQQQSLLAFPCNIGIAHIKIQKKIQRLNTI